MKFNITFKESYLTKTSADFKTVQDKVIPILATVYEQHLPKYFSTAVVNFFDAARLNTGMTFTITLNVRNKTMEVVQAEVLKVSLAHLDGKTINKVKFYANSFELAEEVKVLPKKEEEIILSAEVKLTRKYEF